jgi:hypothetical protein
MENGREKEIGEVRVFVVRHYGLHPQNETKWVTYLLFSLCVTIYCEALFIG